MLVFGHHARQTSAERRFRPSTLWFTAKTSGESASQGVLIRSVDTDLWMIVLLGMSCGRIVLLGEVAVGATVRQVVVGGTRYLLANRE